MTGPKLNEAPVRMRQGKNRGPAQGTRATARWVRTSAWKMREVIDLIRGHSVTEAANILRFCERDAAHAIGKVLASAVANAEANDAMSADELYVSACFVDEGPTVKRFMPRARGRADQIKKRSSHITVIVGRMPEDQLSLARSKSAVGAANRARRTAGQRAAGERAAGAERRAESGTIEAVAGVVADAGGSLVVTDADAAAAIESQDDVSTSSAAGEITPLFTPPAGEPDEINKIIGVGPKLMETLNALGVTTFAQIAEWTDDDLVRIDAVVPRSAEQLSDWRTQAQEILAGTWNRDSTNNT